MAMLKSSKEKFVPGSDGEAEDIFKFPFIVDDATVEFLQEHGRIMFIIRGPPGTGKDSLTKLLLERYPQHSICSADNYFRDTFTSAKRDSSSLRQSHEFCHKKVENACKRSAHPIIVKNTHMRKRELQEYLDFAAEYSYTVIMAITIDKFEVNPEILAKSNTKGLNADYFRNRLRQWENVIPIQTGWFICPDDASYLLNELKKSLDFLLGDGKYCRVLNIFNKDQLLKHYKARKLLYCIAACGEFNTCNEIKSYYLSPNVKGNYGECFTIIIQGYLVTSSYISAVVSLDETMKNLRYIKQNNANPESDVDMLAKQFFPMSLNENFKKCCQTIDFTEEFPTSGKTALKEEQEKNEVINLKYCSFMYLAENSSEKNEPLEMSSLFKMLNNVADKNGIITSDKFVELEGTYKVCRLPSNAWLVRPPFNITFKSIFTGLYV